MILAVGLYFGVIEVLAPLRLDELGAGGAAIGGAFALAAAARGRRRDSAVGRLSDRVGAIGAGCA